ncbi:MULTISPECIES: LLM class flavin-dependent oxidoreductase [Streptomyces]|uniref:LLM class flavin-dependent oxidoreductase n=2 Tax=Streptomyces TaxID=1883 RepID=A0A420UYZ4_9ACTN|nr:MULTISPECIES: LLM class flavin-dependent oxidoreductase [Streptomyces]KNE78920.1 5,10-methylene tetrahydromethanopterin reductase [Streptomyces fradiae]OFA47344.1 5,10-methylene tetrahydromethanopterin reductase [Streptomyces fradiae]PQM21760.1 LLM class flavin-dependent oxidoreductase [Streptomyces xinghaiensis]RKM93193.1 LLM class flavin-dependent oxidoreductase [Streptomyces xinghaiensis]RNC71209.1 LLM class flavin-dependent oxidoreductase [Streptomyces xinghaiensis]
MRFSLFFVGQLSDPTPEREQQMLRDAVEQAVLAEQVGFDRIWAVEHHGLKWYSHMSASEIFLTWVAARTERIRIGHGVVTMPFAYQHPVRVAERAAMLDVLSGGRLDIGAGNGASEQEMALYGVDRERARSQVREALDIITGIWESDRFEWHGSIDIGPGSVPPMPAQRPHPPLFLACSREETLRTAARLGIGALVLGFGGPEMTRLRRAAYDASRAERASQDLLSSTVNDLFAVVCPTVVLDDAEEARTIGLRGQQFFVESSRHWYGGGRPPEQDPAVDGQAALDRTRREVLKELDAHQVPFRPEYVAAYNTDHPYGTAGMAVERVRELAGAGVDEVICLVQMGTVPHDVCLETIRQWGEKVIPRFRSER